ncbi:Uncharacterized protein dnl_14860 [Desulfonema limicola]|uniref:HepT-like domain-containing protein n=1 Tax=Desulfonema limicola TaxID=45656 RepID=A0A975GFI8_9BACT|nr:hypothetical protein [Desulfonema limicola]QTA79230.1 Uncharacterized protein dnl_14860 [Desulfonema limicola]
MNQALLHVCTRINEELVEIEYTVHRTLEGMRKAKETGDDYYLDGVALNLHGFYSGIERIFENIAIKIDGFRSDGKNWHQILLKQMAKENTDIRPAVISDKIFNLLDEYRGFRHIVRNIYSYKFDPERIEKMVVQLPLLFNSLKSELRAFSDFLQRQ